MAAVVLFVGATALAQSLSAQIIPSPRKDPVTVHGLVLNKVTREPVPRALVYSQDNRYAALTDDRGRFEFSFPALESTPIESLSSPTEPQPGHRRFESSFLNAIPATFLARKPGYLPDGDNSQVALSDPSSQLTILLDPEGLITGQVRFSTVDNADRVRIELFRRTVQDGHERWESAGSFTTLTDGEFRFSELTPGTYKLISHEQLDRDPASLNQRGQLFGYQPTFYPDSQDFDSAGPIQLKPGNPVQANLSLVRCEYHSIKIAVANAIAGAQTNITVYPQGHPGPGFALIYNANEQRIQGTLPDGTYTVRVATSGQSESTGTLNFSVHGASLDGLAVTLVPNVTLAVDLKTEFTTTQAATRAPSREPQDPDEESNAVRNSLLQMSLIPVENFGQEQNRISHPVEGADSHSYAIDNVPPGKYWVRVAPGRGFPASVLWGNVNLLRQPLVVDPGGSSFPLAVTLRDDGAEVSGSVLDASISKNPSEESAEFFESSAYVYFIPLGNGAEQFREVSAGPDGAFQEEQLPPGTYRVLAFHRQQDELEYAGPEILRKYESWGQVIQLNPSQKISLPSPLVPVVE